MVPARSARRARRAGSEGPNSMFYTYILFSEKDGKLYHGYSAFLENRIYDHLKGNVPATKNRRPLKLVYYEAFLEEKDAIKKEAYYKTGPGRKFINRHLKHTLEKIKKPR